MKESSVKIVTIAYWAVLATLLAVITQTHKGATITNALVIVYAVVSVICIVYTAHDLLRQIEARKDKRKDFEDIFDRQIRNYDILTRKTVLAALRKSMSEFCKSN